MNIPHKETGMKPGDEVTSIDWERTYNHSGKVMKIIPGGYEVLWSHSKQITYENDESVELRFPNEAP